MSSPACLLLKIVHIYAFENIFSHAKRTRPFSNGKDFCDCAAVLLPTQGMHQNRVDPIHDRLCMYVMKEADRLTYYADDLLDDAVPERIISFNPLPSFPGMLAHSVAGRGLGDTPVATELELLCMTGLVKVRQP